MILFLKEYLKIKMTKLDILYEGKAKILYETNISNELIQFFKDDATAHNAQKLEIINSKGIINNYISEHIMNFLSKKGIDNHFIKRLNSREQLVKKVKIIPIEFVVRNFAFGSIIKRYNLQKEYKFKKPLIELFLKKDELNDPLINDDLITELGWVNKSELADLKNKALIINEHLINLFGKIDIELIDFKIEFGKTVYNNESKLILADEISPDNCRLWDKNTKKNFDKDIFRNNSGDLIEGYQEIIKRLKIKIES